MTTPSTSHETALQKEQRLFRELFARLIDTILNSMFDLRPEKAARRSRYLGIFFLFSGFIISVIYYPLSLWASHLVNILSSLNSPEQLTSALTAFASFIQTIVTDPRILQYLPVFLAPFFIALQSAGMYLADVFELNDVSVARQFISTVALSGSNETIRIKNGEIAGEHQDSPAYLIGGPAKVLVELDSVALFERADGTPHVIGPTGNKPGGKETLEGFERFRQALDIRDHHVTLRDQDDRSKSVSSRSRDGVPINATDVRLMFSIFRGENSEPSAETPYPFDKKAVEQIVYNAPSRVTPEQSNPSTFEFSWINNMIGLIRGRLGRFMSEHNLSAYLASIGLPEIEKLKLREEQISKQMQELTRSDDPDDQKEYKSPPDFQARYKVKNLFAQFTEGFSGQAQKNGVELHWIGVGTWESPVNIVPEKHLEAWLLTQENLKADSPQAMNGIEKSEVANKMKELILKVPLDTFDEITNPKNYKKQGKQTWKKKSTSEYDYYDEDKIIPAEEMGQQYAEVLNILHNMQEENAEYEEAEEAEETDHDNNMKALLIEYRKQLIETADLIKAKNEPVPQNIQYAIKHISNQIGHWAGQ